MSAYQGQRIALLTQHGKAAAIAPVLEPALGCTVHTVDGFDTDTLGTFTRDVPREGSQIEAARRKARIGMDLSGLPVGLASEGSFGPDPFTGLFIWNVELLVLIDDRLGIEVVGMAQGPGHCEQCRTDSWDALADFAREHSFPSHHLVLRPSNEDDPRCRKGVADWDALRQAFDDCLSEAADGHVFVESDLRAFANPSRMAQIGEAAADLRARLASSCPACQAPGYWIAERRPGLPCEACLQPTTAYRETVWRCVRCPHTDTRLREDRRLARSQDCRHCNP